MAALRGDISFRYLKTVLPSFTLGYTVQGFDFKK